MRLVSHFNPVGGFADFWHEFRRPNPYRWPILGASMLLTGGLIWMVAHEEWYGPLPTPKVTYITSFAPDRSDAEIVAGNIKFQQRKDAEAAAEAAREEERKKLYRTLGRAMGMDVEKIEREAAAERAREEAEATRRAAMRSAPVDQPAQR